MSVAALCIIGVAPAAAAQSVRGYQYKVTFKGTGSLNATDNDGSGLQDETENASWDIVPPQPVTLWVPRFNGPPGTSYKVTSSTPDATNPAGSVTESGHYEDSPNGTNVAEAYSCHGTVALEGSSALFTVDVGPYDPTPAIQTDFVGNMEAGTPETPSSCNTDPNRGYEPQTVQGFFESWFPPGTAGNESAEGDMLAVGTLIPAQDIGLASFDLGPAQDYNHVTDPGACRWSGISSNCRIKFQLGGEYQFTLVCGGTVGASSGGGWTGTCGGGSGGSGTGGNGSSGTGGKGGNSGSSGGGSGGSGKQCKVPRVAGDTLAMAKRALKKANCRPGKISHKRSATVRKGHVISSDPKAGTTHKANTPVALEVSSGRH